jgi:hypothetical protein
MGAPLLVLTYMLSLPSPIHNQPTKPTEHARTHLGDFGALGVGLLHDLQRLLPPLLVHLGARHLCCLDAIK